MKSSAQAFVLTCWAIFFVYWIVAALFTKRTAERAGLWSAWWVWLILAVVVTVRRGAVPVTAGAAQWRVTPVLELIGGCTTGAGLVLALWARTILGRNWSATVVFKEQHELIDRGPYLYARHPIYTGVLLMILGSIVVWGRTAGILMFGLAAAGLLIKAHREERLLTRHFPDAYPRYRARVKAAIIPFIL